MSRRSSPKRSVTRSPSSRPGRKATRLLPEALNRLTGRNGLRGVDPDKAHCFGAAVLKGHLRRVAVHDPNHLGPHALSGMLTATLAAPAITLLLGQEEQHGTHDQKDDRTGTRKLRPEGHVRTLKPWADVSRPLQRPLRAPWCQALRKGRTECRQLGESAGRTLRVPWTFTFGALSDFALKWAL